MNNEVKGNGVNFLLLLLNIFIFVTRVMDYYDALNQFSEGSISRVKVYEEMLMVIIWWTLVMLGISFLIESRYAKHKSSTTSRKITILGIFSAICLLPPVFYIMYVNYGLNKPLSIEERTEFNSSYNALTWMLGAFALFLILDLILTEIEKRYKKEYAGEINIHYSLKAIGAKYAFVLAFILLGIIPDIGGYWIHVWFVLAALILLDEVFRLLYKGDLFVYGGYYKRRYLCFTFRRYLFDYDALLYNSKYKTLNAKHYKGFEVTLLKDYYQFILVEISKSLDKEVLST